MARLFNEYAFDVKKIKEICNEYECVSFDVFDTLLKRNVESPFEVWKLVAERVEKDLHISNFCAVREQIQKKLVKKNPYTTLDDIYNKISEIYKCKEILKYEDVEREIEKKIATANSDIKEVYLYCISKGKRIAAISDMYLEKSTIQSMLESSGYKIENVFISCEEGAGKHDGQLFEVVKNKLEWSSKKWLHIGDSYKADILGAKKATVDAFHIDKNISRVCDFSKKIVNKRRYRNTLALLNNELPSLSSFYEKFGFSIVGPLLYGFVIWLLDELESKKITEVFFFSRDGYLMKKAFDKVNRTKIHSHYIYFSRRAIRIPYLANHNSFDEILKQLPPTKLYTARFFLEAIGIEADRYKEICNSLDIELDKAVLLQEIKEQDKYKKLYELIKSDIVDNANKELAMVKKYIEQEGLQNGDAIVDIGWNNSMQYYLENLDHSALTNLQGYYIGISPTAKKVSYAKGFIRDNPLKSNVTSISGFIGLIESLFLAPEGSTKNYKNDIQRILPVLLDYEYKTNEMEYKAFQEIQNGSLKFIEKVEKTGLTCYSLDGYDAFVPLKRFGLNPDYYDICKFGDFRYLSESVTKFAAPKSIFHYMQNMKEFKKDLYESRWKIGFMKKLLKIPLPYNLIYRALKGE